MILARGGGYGDPLAVYDYSPVNPVGYQDTTGKVLVDSAVVPGEKTGIFLIVGQSLVCNTCDGGPYTPVNIKAHNFNIYDRKTYRAVDPLLGCVDPWSNFATEMADMLISAGTFQRVILIPVGVGGVPASAFGYSGKFNHRLRVAVQCLPLFGAPLTGTIWGHGEQDNYQGTARAQYVSPVREAIDTVRGMGCAAPFFIARESMIFGNTSAAIQAAQAAVIDNITIFAGANMDSIPTSERQAGDLTHLSAVGRHHAAALWQAVLSAHF